MSSLSRKTQRLIFLSIILVYYIFFVGNSSLESIKSRMGTDMTTTEGAPVAATEARSNDELKNLVGKDNTRMQMSKTAGEIAEAIESGEQIFLFNVGAGKMCGLGSLTNNMLLLHAYFSAFQRRRKLVIAQHELNLYRWNETHGIFTGFLETSDSVINTVAEFERIKDELANYNATLFGNKEKVWGFSKKRTYTLEHYRRPVLSITANHATFLLKAREVAFEFFKGKDKPELYYQMATKLCSTINFSNEAKSKILRILNNASIPTFADSAGPTVSFHIRRSDKKKETRYFEIQEYVATMKKALGSDLSSVTDCFVATDDYECFLELEVALRNVSIPCKLHTLTNPDYQTTRGNDDTILFLAQMQLLIYATYFIGTFNSNVGSLTSLFRACSGLKGTMAESSLENNFEHHFRSFGVDRESWKVT